MKTLVGVLACLAAMAALSSCSKSEFEDIDDFDYSRLRVTYSKSHEFSTLIKEDGSTAIIDEWENGGKGSMVICSSTRAVTDTKISLKDQEYVRDKIRQAKINLEKDKRVSIENFNGSSETIAFDTEIMPVGWEEPIEVKTPHFDYVQSVLAMPFSTVDIIQVQFGSTLEVIKQQQRKAYEFSYSYNSYPNSDILMSQLTSPLSLLLRNEVKDWNNVDNIYVAVYDYPEEGSYSIFNYVHVIKDK